MSSKIILHHKNSVSQTCLAHHVSIEPKSKSAIVLPLISPSPLSFYQLLAMPTPLEVDTPAYKKALRHHLKSSKTAPAEAIPALREQEKCFKTRFPPPSLENVLDISWDETHGLGWKGSQILEALIPFRCEGGKRAFGFQSLPG